jgi:hypothetical protein
MITAKEKAQELYSAMLHKIEGLEGTDWYESAKQCALIAVDELEKQEAKLLGYNSERYSSEYWQEVKDEIQNL